MIKFKKVSFDNFLKSLKDCNLSYSETEARTIYDLIKLPKRSTSTSAGYDFFFPFKLKTKEGKYPLGIKAYMNPENVLLLFPRSSLGMKYGFTLSNTTGVIDSDYVDNETNEGHIMIKFSCEKEIEFESDTKICQGIFINYVKTDDDIAIEKRTGGIGSTGK